MPKVILNGQPESTYVRSARMACIETGVDHELRPLGDDSIESVLAALRSQDYLKKHPFARMPSLEDGSIVVFETSAISRYLSRKYGKDCLVPAEMDEAVRMEQWVSAFNCYVIPDTVRKFAGPLVLQSDPDLEAVEREKPALRAHYEIIDRALQGRTLLAGDRLSIADLLLAPILDLVGMLPGGAPLFEGLENLGRWWSQVSQLPSFNETRVGLPRSAKERAA